MLAELATPANFHGSPGSNSHPVAGVKLPADGRFTLAWLARNFLLPLLLVVSAIPVQAGVVRPIPVPGRIEAEDYDTNGAGVSYQDTAPGNSGNVYRQDDVDIEPTTDTGGGYNVGWI